MSTALDAVPIVRLCAPAEVDARRDDLCALAVRAKASWGYDEAFLAGFAEIEAASMRTPGLLVFLAELGDDLAGFATLEFRGETGWLEDLWVDPAWQRHGIGAHLLRRVIDESIARGCVRLECESDPNAEAFYVHVGAQRFAERASTVDAGRMLPLMCWDISAG